MVKYRGTITIGEETFTEDASMRMGASFSQTVNTQCMLAVVNKLLRRVKKEIVQDLAHQFEQSGTFDNSRSALWTVCELSMEMGVSLRGHKLQVKMERGNNIADATFIIRDSETVAQYGFEPGGRVDIDGLPDHIKRTAEIRYSTRTVPQWHNPEQLRGATRMEHLYGRSRLRDIEANATAIREMDRSYREARANFLPIDMTVNIDGNWGNDRLPAMKPFRLNRDTPERRAMSLLARKIGKARYRSLKKVGFFEEQGRHGVYQFHKDKQGGVTFSQKISVGGLKERTVSWDLCVQSQAPDLPNGDVILSRWLEWRADEDRFLETANFRNIRTSDEATEYALNSWDHIASRIAQTISIPSYMMGLAGMVDQHPRS